MRDFSDFSSTFIHFLLVQKGVFSHLAIIKTQTVVDGFIHWPFVEANLRLNALFRKTEKSLFRLFFR